MESKELELRILKSDILKGKAFWVFPIIFNR